MIEQDLQDRGLDLGDRELLAARSWPWLQTRVLGLLTTADSRLFRVLIPQPRAAAV